MKSIIKHLAGQDTRLAYDLDPALMLLRADPAQLQRIVINLVTNARDAMPSGGLLTIKTRNEGGHACLTITDTGVGMSSQTRARIFEPFFSTKSEGLGAGLGLASTYQIVKQLGGEIHVYSKQNVGSTFVAAPQSAFLT